MAELVHECEHDVAGSSGLTYRGRVFAEENEGSWRGWIEFVPAGGVGPVLRTGDETTQASLEAVLYWASGLEPVYLEGALARAAAAGD